MEKSKNSRSLFNFALASMAFPCGVPEFSSRPTTRPVWHSRPYYHVALVSTATRALPVPMFSRG